MKNSNLLPYDGEAYYFGKVLNNICSQRYYNAISDSAEWKHDEVRIFGKVVVTKRMTAWYGDEGCAYKYSGIMRVPNSWTKELLELRRLVESLTKIEFNSCLLNLYHKGDEGMSWHSDDESSLGRDIVIASMSLGAERRFLFRHMQSGKKAEVILENGSLLLMKGETQFHWQHSLPKSKRISEPRINLTFRKIVKQSYNFA